ncbi:MAG TPA: aldo/keto reductase, partial [Anaerolineae bacterium]
MISGKATISGTVHYAGRHPAFTFNTLNDTGLYVNQAGFGAYRVDASVDSHRQALRHALLNGINLVDTSANYADGGSEKLIGEVVGELVASGSLVREAVVVVSKVGYIQGQNYELVQRRKAEGRPFADVVNYAEGLDHCIHPEFLEDQLTRSLARLNMDSLDCYLLHNPEYYLSWAKRAQVARSEARREYYRRIELAFRHLEKEVERGRIQWYGISSNTFPSPAEDAEFTSLETVWDLAQSIASNQGSDHHFRVIQLPMNLLETGAATEKNQSSDRSVLEFAREKKLAVLVNRPLNAIDNNELTRLADVPPPNYPATVEEVS